MALGEERCSASCTHAERCKRKRQKSKPRKNKTAKMLRPPDSRSRQVRMTALQPGIGSALAFSRSFRDDSVFPKEIEQAYLLGVVAGVQAVSAHPRFSVGRHASSRWEGLAPEMLYDPEE